MEQVIIVDTDDNQIGVLDKHAAHEQGLLHRAFSIFIYRKVENDIEILLQQRADKKYHSAGLWSNACCGHPRPEEETPDAAKRRLMEEMNIETDIKEVGVFQYQANFENGMTENEIDHVFVGELDQDKIDYNRDEVKDYAWISRMDLEEDLAERAKRFTPWFIRAFGIFSESVG